MRPPVAPHPDLSPLEFLIGRWVGAGVGGYPTIESFHFEQELVIQHDGRPLLIHAARSWLLDSETGERVRPSAAESGFWRPAAAGEVELLLAHGSGFLEIWIGRVSGLTVQLVTDVVARTASAKEVTGGRRAYGLVEEELLVSYDMAAVGEELQPHLSVRMRRAD